MKEFEQLKIDNSFIRTITFEPSRIIRITLLTYPISDEALQVVGYYDLEFRAVHQSLFSFDARPWLEIRSHEVLSSSDYRQQSVTEQNDTSESTTQHKAVHFRLTLAEGWIDIIAENFTGSLVEEIPCAGPVQMPLEGALLEQTSSDSSFENELTCSFCGKTQTEVSKMIEGATANICDECVMTCSRIISVPNEPT